jgi:hypothetical protein
VFQHSADNFNKNPELANALARVSASDIDAFALVDKDQGAPSAAVPFTVDDAQRMAFLSSQTADGRTTLDMARQQYDDATLYQMTHGGSAGGVNPHDAARQLAGIDAYVDNAERNAQIYQHANDVAQHNQQAQDSHDSKQEIGDDVKKLVDTASLPGGPVAGAVRGIAEDKAYKELMDTINPQPTPQTVQYPSLGQVELDGDQKFHDTLDAFAKSGSTPLDMNDVRDAYRYSYNTVVNNGLVKNNSDLDQLATGGAQAPDNPSQTKNK